MLKPPNLLKVSKSRETVNNIKLFAMSAANHSLSDNMSRKSRPGDL